ncbi:hypothetical protein KFE25_009384 [Diacronema lutheri]|uniref:Uncharacterized protein n=2 Tax=Diacronema lutheri TaxID=2081491 RepID=A0A8J6CKD7_DIALT|nr:hypothetical protein KFE25_009384 [Diacronema lutheri]
MEDVILSLDPRARMERLVDGSKTAGQVVDGVTEAVIQSLSEHINLTRAHRRLQALARVLICATFLEDALRMVMSFRMQVTTIITIARAGYLPIPPKECWLVVVLSAVVQALGAGAVLLERRELAGCVSLICWCCVHPFLYAQMRNGEFVSETLSVIGGLCILLSHLKEMRAVRRELLPTGPLQLPGAPASDRLCQLGRVLLCSYFVFYFCAKMASIFAGEHRFHAALVELVLMMLLVYMCAAIVVGSRSRRVALGLAVVMCVSNFVFHPFWYFWAVGSAYVSLDNMKAVATRLPVDMSVLSGADGSTSALLAIADHERYFFFQRLSTVGALVLLAVYGPGRHSLDEPSAPAMPERHMAKGRD